VVEVVHRDLIVGHYFHFRESLAFHPFCTCTCSSNRKIGFNLT